MLWSNGLRYIGGLALAAMIATSIYPSATYAAWDLDFAWTTGDLSPRVTGPAAVYDREQTGSSVHFLAPVQHGLSSYDRSGNFEWTFTGLTLAYDIYTIVTGDLRGTGYNDTIVVGGGFNASTGYQIGILDQDGTVIQRIKLTNGTKVLHSAIDGTDIYVATDYGITKYVKSGSTWAEDWSTALSGGALHVAVDDMGNGKRVYAVRNGAAYSLYPADGSEEWTATTGGYTSQFRIGKVNNSVTGKQMVVPRQTGTNVIDKDGNSLGAISTGTNVRTGVTLYDVDGDGEEEIYISDMGDDIYVFEPSGTNTYTQKYSLLDAISQPGLAHFDINDDGVDEIIAGSDDGSFAIMTPDLSTTLMSTSTGHGNMGGHNMAGLLGNKMNGTLFADVDGDGHEDLVISGSSGYLDAWRSTGLAAPWYSDDWSYRVAVTVDAGLVGAALTDFPVYVDLGDLPADFHAHVKSDGGDIRVTKADGTTEVPREVVAYDAASDTGELHFKGDLSNSIDTTFYIYYGNSGASDYAASATYGAENVWTNGYKGVWHMKDGTTLSAADSTANHNDGTISTPSATAGQLDGAGSFNGSTDRIILPRTASLSQTTGWTLQAWTYPTTAPQGPGVIAEAYAGAESSVNDSDVQYELGFGINEGTGGSSALKVGFYNGNWYTTVDPAGNIPLNAWVAIAGSWNGTSLVLYKNGSQVASSSPGSAVPTGSGKFFIGRRHDAAGSVNFFPGYIDEVRISSSARSSSWISTEYNNQSSPATFYAIGAEEGDAGDDGEGEVGQTVIFLTSSSSWTVPSDWNSASNTIEVIGGGGGGGGGRARPVIDTPQGGGGGGGGAYARVTNASFTAGGSVSYSVGTAGSAGAASGAGGAGGDTWFSSTGTLLAEGGGGGNDPSSGTGGAGGSTGNSVGSVTYSGGNGGNGSTGSGGSAGGGGAAGPNGDGNNGGGSGSPSGGSGDAGYGGTGGTGSASPTAGGSGTEWDATHGSGGGAGGNNSSDADGLSGGNYGGGGSGGTGPGKLGGAGAPGLIVITYTPGSGEEIAPRELRLRGGVRLKGGVRLR